MRRTFRRSVLAAGGTLLAATAWRKWPPAAGARADDDPVQPPAAIRAHPPHPLPPLSFLDAAGRPRTLDALRAGRPVLLNLWATWCVPCVNEMPALAALARTLQPDGIGVLCVSLDHGGADAVRRFFAAHRIADLPVLLDPHGGTLEALGLSGIPVTLLVDRAGREVARLEGPVDWSGSAAVARVRTLLGRGPG